MFSFLTGYVMGERSAARAATFARGAAASSATLGQSDIGELHDRIDRMLLVMDAMWDLLKAEGMTDDQLAAKIRELDETDGTVDGKRTAMPVMCDRCNAMISPERESCVFCGAQSPTAPGPLDTV